MIHGRRGQVRVIEALFTCAMIFVGLTAAIFFSNKSLVAENKGLDEVALNIIDVLNDPDVIKEVINKEEGWETYLKSLMENLLPPDTFYNLTILSSLNNQVIAEISKIPDQNNTLNSDSVSFDQVLTISLPISRSEIKKIDAILVTDKSGSMDEKEPGDQYSKMYYAKEAGKAFVDQLNASKDMAGLVSFSTEATLDAYLTNNFDSVKNAIDALYAYGWTNIGGGIEEATQEFQSNGRGDSLWAMILLSDGEANRPYNETYARTYALEQAEIAANLGISIYTIGLGANTSSFDEDLLKQIATEGYYYAPSAEDLTDIYLMIVEDLLFEVNYDVITVQIVLLRAR